MVRGKGGYTMLEALIATGIMAFVAAGAVAMMIGSARCFDDTSVQAFTDTDAAIAMQMIVNDVREAKSINIIGGGRRLRVIFPKKTEQGYYDRHESDMANQIDFYLSDETGVPGHTGTWLWKGKNNNNRQPLKKDVSDLSFEPDTARSVKITIVTQNSAASGPKETRLTERVVYLRNY